MIIPDPLRTGMALMTALGVCFDSLSALSSAISIATTTISVFVQFNFDACFMSRSLRSSEIRTETVLAIDERRLVSRPPTDIALARLPVIRDSVFDDYSLAL